MVAWEGYLPEENSWEPFEMLEDTAMQALQQLYERYRSKPKDHRVIDNPNQGNKRRRLRSEDRLREDGSSVTTLRWVATITITLAQMEYQVVTRGAMVWNISIQECWFA